MIENSLGLLDTIKVYTLIMVINITIIVRNVYSIHIKTKKLHIGFPLNFLRQNSVAS